MGGLAEKAYAYSPYGPVNRGLTTTQYQGTPMADQDQQLTELLNSLEKKVATLVSKSYEVLDTFESGIKTHLVEPTDIVYDTAGISVQ
jgi:site-specific DNA-adenine methylase